MKKILSVSILIIALVFVLGVNTVKAETIAELQAKINALLQQIAQVQQLIAQLQGGNNQNEGDAWCHNFNTNLRHGSVGDDVLALQIALEKQGFDVGDDLGSTEAMSYFRDKTASAVSGFQEKYASEILFSWGLSHGTGYVGNTTRAKLNQLYGCGISIPTTPTTHSIIPSTSFVNFNVVQGDSNPQPVGFVLTNASSVPVSFKLSVPNQPAWLNASYNTETMSLSAGGVMGVGASVDATKVGIGTHTTNLIVSGNFANSPITIPITLTVAPKATSASDPSIYSINPSQGAGDNLVIITGKNLNASGNTIQFYQNGIFMGSQYDATSFDGNRLEFTLSNVFAKNANPGVYQLRLSNSNGVSNFINFTIFPSQSAPVIKSIDPNQGGGVGTTITVNGSGFISSNNTTVLEFQQNGKMVASIPAKNISVDGTQFQVSLGAVFVGNVDIGQYQIVVKNSNGKSNSVNFTLNSGEYSNNSSVKKLNVRYPGAGRCFEIGKYASMTWTYTGDIDKIDIDLIKSDNTYSYSIAKNVAVSLYEYNWIPPNVLSGDYKIRIIYHPSGSFDTSIVFDMSETFRIASPGECVYGMLVSKLFAGLR